MAAPIRLRDDYDGNALRDLARRSKDGVHPRRLLSLAAIYDGASRTEAARIGGVGIQVVRNWALRFNAVGPDGLLDRKAPGKTSVLDENQRKALVALVEKGPMRRSRASSACVCRICPNGCGRNTACRGAAKPLGGSCGPRATPNFPPDLGIIPRTPRPWLRSKNSPPAWRKSPPTNRIFQSYDDIVDHCMLSYRLLMAWDCNNG